MKHSRLILLVIRHERQKIRGLTVRLHNHNLLQSWHERIYEVRTHAWVHCQVIESCRIFSQHVFIREESGVKKVSVSFTIEVGIWCDCQEPNFLRWLIFKSSDWSMLVEELYGGATSEVDCVQVAVEPNWKAELGVKGLRVVSQCLIS